MALARSIDELPPMEGRGADFLSTFAKLPKGFSSTMVREMRGFCKFSDVWLDGLLIKWIGESDPARPSS